jgi:putative phosphoesterase
MRVAVLSDTHLRRVTDEFKAFVKECLCNMDAILHAGDYVSAEVVDFLGKWPFHGVHGNMDCGEIKERLPRKRIVAFGKHRVGLIHGWGSAGDLEGRIAHGFEGVDVIVYGHSHRAANHVKDGVLMFNPGSMTGPFVGSVSSYGILELDEQVRGRIERAVLYAADRKILCSEKLK